jgi:predicted transcriptional regulator
LSREKVSRAFLYSPAVERETLLLDTMGQIANQLGARDTGALMASFVQRAEQDDPGNLDRLQQLIDERRKRRGDGGDDHDE